MVIWWSLVRCCQSHRLSEHPASTFEAKLPVTTTMAISSGKRNMADRDGGVARLWVGGITQRRRRTFTKMFGWYADVSSETWPNLVFMISPAACGAQEHACEQPAQEIQNRIRLESENQIHCQLCASAGSAPPTPCNRLSPHCIGVLGRSCGHGCRHPVERILDSTQVATP